MIVLCYSLYLWLYCIIHFTYEYMVLFMLIMILQYYSLYLYFYCVIHFIYNFIVLFILHNMILL